MAPETIASPDRRFNRFRSWVSATVDEDSASRLLKVVAPVLAAYRANQVYERTKLSTWASDVRQAKELLLRCPEHVPLVRMAYEADLARIERLENKLQELNGQAYLIVGLALPAVGWVIRSHEGHGSIVSQVNSFVIGTALLHVVAASLVLTQGFATRPIALTTRQTLLRALSTPSTSTARVAAQELAAMEYNVSASVVVSNWITAIRHTIAWILITLGLAAGLTLLQQRF